MRFLPGWRRSAGLHWWTCFLISTAAGFAQRIELVWPTPSTAWAEGKSATSFLQHAGSGDPQSGGFGGVRSSGTRFHEGIDIKPVKRDRRGEPLDSVFAAMPGVVRYTNSSAGDSSYGRYVVLEHPQLSPAIYTLYAHLARIASGVTRGTQVAAGQTLGVMGHSAGGYMIPKDRSHLHFEVGVAVTRDFQAWYDRKRFGSRNEHGMWNGMNLLGIDPLDFFNQWRLRRIETLQDYFARMETAVRLRIATYRTPDFVTRYPALVTKPVTGLVGGWDIRFTWTGLPFSWTPLTAAEVAELPREEPRIVEVDAAVERRERSKTLAVPRRGSWAAAKDLEIVLEQLFGP
ncbi:MAG: M23 family metallopeptidase [Opitutaceae bacterium]|nr:M23 family metallopeptidase [Opitutaceae bacterium]